MGSKKEKCHEKRRIGRNEKQEKRKEKEEKEKE